MHLLCCTQVCVWSELSDNHQWKLTLPPLDLPQPVTAVDFAPRMLPSSKCVYVYIMHTHLSLSLSLSLRYLLAAGLEGGQLLMLQLSLSATEWHPLTSVHAR